MALRRYGTYWLGYLWGGRFVGHVSGLNPQGVIFHFAIYLYFLHQPPDCFGGLLVKELRRALSGCNPILKAVMAMKSLLASSTSLKHSQYRTEDALSASPGRICIAQRESACFGWTSLVMNLALKDFCNWWKVLIEAGSSL